MKCTEKQMDGKMKESAPAIVKVFGVLVLGLCSLLLPIFLGDVLLVLCSDAGLPFPFFSEDDLPDWDKEHAEPQHVSAFFLTVLIGFFLYVGLWISKRPDWMRGDVGAGICVSTTAVTAIIAAIWPTLIDYALVVVVMAFTGFVVCLALCVLLWFIAKVDRVPRLGRRKRPYKHRLKKLTREYEARIQAIKKNPYLDEETREVAVESERNRLNEQVIGLGDDANVR